MKKIIFIQPILPKYSIDFFNVLAGFKKFEIIVLADIKTQNALNQFTGSKCDFKVIHLEQKQWKGIVYRPKLFSILKSISTELIIYNGNPRDISQLCHIVLSSFSKEKKLVWGMFHRIGGPRLVSEAYYKLIGVLSDNVLTYSSIGASAQVLRGTPNHKVKIMGTAINEKDVFEHANSRSKSEINKFKQDNDLFGKKVILQVVRLSHIKRPKLLIDATTHLLKTRKDIAVILIGGGDLQNQLKELVVKNSLESYIRFLGPLYDEEQLSYWFLSSDVFVIPTCIGLSAHHAMCYGLPIITDDNLAEQASEYDLLKSGLNSLTYRSGSAIDLSKTINQLFNDNELSELISKNAIHTVKNIYNIRSKANNFLNIIAESTK